MSQFNFNEQCENLLARYNNRNAERVAQRLGTICESLRREGYRTVQTKLGGSVKKGTFVSGLSDVDALLFVNQTSLANQSPSKVIKHVQKIVKQRLPNNQVNAGKLAVTVNYSNGMEIQLLPALRTKSGSFRIAEFGSTKWSNIVIPDNFVGKLTKVNRGTDGRAVQVIKLAKAMANCFIKRDNHKIIGYHMEALAVDAFKDYREQLDPQSMLVHLFKHANHNVMIPMDDSTHQTTHVDQYLGPANSKLRKAASTHFGQMQSKVESCKTRDEFNKLFCMGK